MILIEDHSEFASYQAQPLYVKYLHPKTGKITEYPPDGLVRWTSDRPPLLVEIKYRNDCAGKWREFRAKFRAAKSLCLQNGWDFAVITEEDARIVELFNVNFLSGYKNRKPDLRLSQKVIDLLEAKSLSMREISDELSRHGETRGEVVSCCWTLAARRQISMDWAVKVNANTRFWVEK